MDKYFYFRDVADEVDDDDASASVVVPVNNITAIGPHNSITTLNIWFKNLKNEVVNDYVTLTVTRGKMKEVMAELVSAMNSGPHSDGFVVIADNVATTTNASSIQGNDVTVSTSYISNDITSVSVVTS